MATDPPDLPAIAARRDMILDRLATLEGPVDSLMQRQTVEAQAFVCQDERGQSCAWLDLRDFRTR